MTVAKTTIVGASILFDDVTWKIFNMDQRTDPTGKAWREWSFRHGASGPSTWWSP